MEIAFTQQKQLIVCWPWPINCLLSLVSHYMPSKLIASNRFEATNSKLVPPASKQLLPLTNNALSLSLPFQPLNIFYRCRFSRLAINLLFSFPFFTLSFQRLFLFPASPYTRLQLVVRRTFDSCNYVIAFP